LDAVARNFAEPVGDDGPNPLVAVLTYATMFWLCSR
jgi:hypothetical protein